MENKYYKISGIKDNKRISSRILEEMIQSEIEQGHFNIEVEAFGQHGIGGRLWRAGNNKVKLKITGHSGQRAGSLGFPNTEIDIIGPASDDIGWLNAGAVITVHGNASNGVMNGAAQGKVYIKGNIGARGMTMTKCNPRFDPPELWVLGSAGDYFGEFMAGGIAVICGFNELNFQAGKNVLGYRPLVGMVEGKVFFRGNACGYSEKDAKIFPVSDGEWDWLLTRLEFFLNKIEKQDLFNTLSNRCQWQVLKAKTPTEKLYAGTRISIKEFRNDVWDRELGRGGLIGDLQTIEKGAIPLITRGEMRRFIPVWEQGKYKSPCQAACPIGIPVQERWHMIRTGLTDEAVEMGLEYTPFPAVVCGYLCPNPCMASCTRNLQYMTPIDMTMIGRKGENIRLPQKKEKTGKKIAIIGAGPGGISAAWHLTLKGHEAVLFDEAEEIGGKIFSVIPQSRIPQSSLKHEIDRIKELIPDIRTGKPINAMEFQKIKNKFDYTIVAGGAKKPKMLPVPGIEKAVSALEFLCSAKKIDNDKIIEQSMEKFHPRKVVIIGAGNVGCDAATEAHRLGAEKITMIDVQKPAAFGKEKEDAAAAGAIVKWPCFTKEITDQGVVLETGELLEADLVVVSIGDVPDLDFLGKTITARHGFVVTDEFNRTSDPRVFAVGDIVSLGLITDAIGAGKRAAQAIDFILNGKNPEIIDPRPEIDPERVSLEYYNPRIQKFDNMEQCAGECASCGRCRDCGICIEICPEGAIERFEIENHFNTDHGVNADHTINIDYAVSTGDEINEDHKINAKTGINDNIDQYEYRADPEKCIGCGFCAGACPCGIWSMVPNFPL